MDTDDGTGRFVGANDTSYNGVAYEPDGRKR